jgi:pilus assembly protein Flp/PilA
MFKSLIADEAGATMVEYGIMVALIAALSILVIKSLGSKVSNAFSSVNTNMP